LGKPAGETGREKVKKGEEREKEVKGPEKHFPTLESKVLQESNSGKQSRAKVR
jgi:hypothetical protein